MKWAWTIISRANQAMLISGDTIPRTISDNPSIIIVCKLNVIMRFCHEQQHLSSQSKYEAELGECCRIRGGGGGGGPCRIIWSDAWSLFGSGVNAINKAELIVVDDL